MTKTIFDDIVRGEHHAYIVWENAGFLAFLTPFPNTPGVTVVIPKTNPGDYVFEIDDDTYHALLDASKKVALLLQKALGVPRVAMVFEGTGIPYVHTKLQPLHGPKASMSGIWPEEREFTEEYRGYLTTLEGFQMDTTRLRYIQQKILASNQE